MDILVIDDVSLKTCICNMADNYLESDMDSKFPFNVVLRRESYRPELILPNVLNSLILEYLEEHEVVNCNIRSLEHLRGYEIVMYNTKLCVQTKIRLRSNFTIRMFLSNVVPEYLFIPNDEYEAICTDLLSLTDNEIQVRYINKNWYYELLITRAFCKLWSIRYHQ